MNPSFHAEKLKKEAVFLFGSLFSCKSPDTLTQRYIDYHQRNKHQEKQIDIEYIINKSLDVEAMELALRSKNSILTKKLLIIIRLAEVEPILFTLMVNQKNCFLIAFSSLFYFLIRSIYKKIKGQIILWRHPKCMMQ
jgi:hypothetical protein